MIDTTLAMNPMLAEEDLGPLRWILRRLIRLLKQRSIWPMAVIRRPKRFCGCAVENA